MESCLSLDGSRCRPGLWDPRGRTGEGSRPELQAVKWDQLWRLGGGGEGKQGEEERGSRLPGERAQQLLWS